MTREELEDFVNDEAEEMINLSDSGSYIDQVQAEVDARLDDAGYFDDDDNYEYDIREEGCDDGYYKLEDAIRAKSKELADQIIEDLGGNIEEADEETVEDAVASAVENAEDEYNEIYEDTVLESAESIASEAISNWEDYKSNREEDEAEDEDESDDED